MVLPAVSSHARFEDEGGVHVFRFQLAVLCSEFQAQLLPPII